MELNREAYQKLIDDDLEWLRQQPRTLERDHVEDCMRWLRENKPTKQSLYLLIFDDSGIDEWVFHGVFEDSPEGWESIARITRNGVGYQVVRGSRIRHCNPRDEDD